MKKIIEKKKFWGDLSPRKKVYFKGKLEHIFLFKNKKVQNHWRKVQIHYALKSKCNDQKFQIFNL